MAFIDEYSTPPPKNKKKPKKLVIHSGEGPINTSFRDEVRAAASAYSEENVHKKIDDEVKKKLEGFVSRMCSLIRGAVKSEASSAQNGKEYINGMVSNYYPLSISFSSTIANSPYADYAFKYSKKGMQNGEIGISVIEKELVSEHSGFGIFRSSREYKRTVRFCINPELEKYIESIIKSCKADGIEVEFKIRVVDEKSKEETYINPPTTMSWWNNEKRIDWVFAFSFKM